MAKCIKCAGIVFFALVLFFLLMAGIFSVNAVEGNGIINANDESIVGNNSDTTLIDDEFVPDFTLTGVSNYDVWETAVITSILQAGDPVKVLMTANWTADLIESTKTSFGAEEKGFYNGEICVPAGANIILNLNGYTINRNQPIMIANGAVIVVRGELTIMDSKYNFDTANKLFNALPTGLKYSLNVGKITGGKNNGDAGGIYCGANSKLNVYGGMVYENYASTSGGGIFGDIGSEINFYDGVVVNNTAVNRFGGGIAVSAGTLNIHNGIIANNICGTHGAGVSADSASGADGGLKAFFKMYDGIIGYNYSNNFGAGLAIYGVDAELHGGQIINNQSATNSAGVTVWKSNGIPTYFKIFDGLIARNKLDYLGHNEDNGGVGLLVGDQSTIEMLGGEISENVMTSSINKKMNGAGINVITRGNLILKGGTIKNNIITDSNGKISAGAGVAIRDANCTIQISGNPQLFDNYCNGKNSDLYLCSNTKIAIQDNLNCHIGVELAENYGTGTFTTGYGAGNTNPSEFFFSNDGAKLATLNGSEVSFENTVESEIYDYIYFENGKRNNYKDNNLTHAVNDYAKSKQVNGGKLILGNILPNTSVNTFIQNINFDRTKVKLYDSNNKLIYDKGNSVAGVDSSLYDKKLELAVGTGWRLETYTASGAKIEEFALSVLGDSNGNGRISASDVTYIREIANNTELYNNLNAEIKLASLIINKGKVTSADSEIVLNVIAQKLTIDLFY